MLIVLYVNERSDLGVQYLIVQNFFWETEIDI